MNNPGVDEGGHRSEPGGERAPLDYATAGLDRRPPAVEWAVVLLSIVQAAVVIFWIVTTLDSARSSTDGTDDLLLAAGLSADVALSIVALIGGAQPTAVRQWCYRLYVGGLPVLAAITATTIAVRAPSRDRDAAWLAFVVAGILNPAWLLLLLRGRR